MRGVHPLITDLVVGFKDAINVTTYLRGGNQKSSTIKKDKLKMETNSEKLQSIQRETSPLMVLNTAVLGK